MNRRPKDPPASPIPTLAPPTTVTKGARKLRRDELARVIGARAYLTILLASYGGAGWMRSRAGSK